MKRALIVGIDNYPSAPLHGCINDASAVSTILETHGDGAPNFDCQLKTHLETKSELKGLIVDLFKTDSVETALFYFSGHGCIDAYGGCIVMPDFKTHDEGVSMDEILKIANGSKIRNKIIILDCCYSGLMGENRDSVGHASNIGEGVTILTASRNDESAVEIRGHGIFTNLLLDALQGGAADLKGDITPGSVYAYIDQALGAWDQRPVFKTNVTRFISLRTVSPQVSSDVLRKIVEYFPSAEQEFSLDPSFEDTNSLDIEHAVIEPYAKPENVAIFKTLQKFQGVGLVVPVDAPYMYFAAMNSKSCRLTALGYHYWRLVKDKKL